jgi:hypothetical protein
VELHYGYYPESIVTAGTTWLGEEFDSALLNGTLVEAIRFNKGEPDMVSPVPENVCRRYGATQKLRGRQDAGRYVPLWSTPYNPALI